MVTKEDLEKLYPHVVLESRPGATRKIYKGFLYSKPEEDDPKDESILSISTLYIENSECSCFSSTFDVEIDKELLQEVFTDLINKKESRYTLEELKKIRAEIEEEVRKL
jgi:hypothetical protein